MKDQCLLKNYACNSHNCCHYCNNKKCIDRCNDDITKCKFITDSVPEMCNYALEALKLKPVKSKPPKEELPVPTKIIKEEKDITQKYLINKYHINYGTIYYLRNKKHMSLQDIDNYYKNKK